MRSFTSVIYNPAADGAGFDLLNTPAVFAISPSRTPPTEIRMSPNPTPPNPSRTVERIREIIVGRQLDRLEQRIARLEASGPVAGARIEPVDDRLLHAEARMEAVRHSLERLAENLRQDMESRSHQQRAEIQRLATQIQQVAAARAGESETEAVRQLEARLGNWLNQWQGALQRHLDDREKRLLNQIRGEVASLWENTENQITRMQSNAVDREWIERRLSRVADAARALADAAAPMSGNTDFTSYR